MATYYRAGQADREAGKQDKSHLRTRASRKTIAVPSPCASLGPPGLGCIRRRQTRRVTMHKPSIRPVRGARRETGNGRRENEPEGDGDEGGNRSRRLFLLLLLMLLTTTMPIGLAMLSVSSSTPSCNSALSCASSSSSVNELRFCLSAVAFSSGLRLLH